MPQNADTLSEEQPLLPRHLQVALPDTAAAKRNSISVPERKDTEQGKKLASNADGVDDDDDVAVTVAADGQESRVRYASKVKVQAEQEQAVSGAAQALLPTSFYPLPTKTNHRSNHVTIADSEQIRRRCEHFGSCAAAALR